MYSKCDQAGFPFGCFGVTSSELLYMSGSHVGNKVVNKICLTRVGVCIVRGRQRFSKVNVSSSS